MNLLPNSSRKRPGLRPTPAMPHKVQLTTLRMQLDGSPSGTVKLSSLSRLRATMVRRSRCSSNSANVGPHRKRTPPRSSIPVGGDVVAAEIEQIIDLVVGGEAALRLAGTLLHGSAVRAH